VLDTLGGPVHAASAEVLKPGGVLAYLNAAPPASVARRDVNVRQTDVRATRERLERLLALNLRVPVEARFALEQAAAAYERSRHGHARGKIIVQVG
jgi:NADPH:quinone reductase-like Zn-dependent oxidoreductase